MVRVKRGSVAKARRKKVLKFSKGWINKNDVKPISYKEKNPFRKISIFIKLLVTKG